METSVDPSYLRTLTEDIIMDFVLYLVSTKISILKTKLNQRTNGPVNAHLYGLGKHKTYKTWKIYCKEMTLTLNIHTFIISISCLHLPTFMSQAAIVSEKSTVFTFSRRKA